MTKTCNFIICTLLMTLISACSTQIKSRLVSEQDRAWLLSGAALPGEDTTDLQLPEEDIFGLSEEMNEVTESIRSQYGSRREQVQALLEYIMHPGSLGLEYDPDATFTAREAFYHHRANCLSFTILIVALAREMGLKASFNEVDIPPVWDMQNTSTLVLYKHVNAVIETYHSSKQLVDINMEEYDSSFKQRIITDRLAEAQYYNNRAMEYLYQDNYADSLRYLLKALSVEPDVSYLWANLGTLYRRSNKLHAAELAYQTALDIDPSDLVAISNAARLYTRLGKPELAHEYEIRADKFRRKNPYFQYKLGLDEFINENYKIALDHIEKAIRLYPDEHRFYFLGGVIYRQLGEREMAGKYFQKAIDLTTEPEQSLKYKRKSRMLLSSK